MRLSLAAAVIGLMLATPSQSAEVNAGIDMVSAYVFRGVTYNDGPCLQPYLETTAGRFTIAVWTNFDLADYALGESDSVQAGDFSEVDLGLTYGFCMGPVDLSLGVTQFLFPEAGRESNTREAFGSVDIPITGGVRASAYAGYDFDLVDDIYASLGLSYELPLETPSLTLATKAGYAGEKASAGGKAGLHEYEVKLEGSYPLTDTMQLGGFVLYTAGIDEKVLPEQDIQLVGGLKLSYSF